MKNELTAKRLHKGYRIDKSVFENANFKTESGFIYGLVAPNGAGKTTLMKCVAGISKFIGQISYNNVRVGSHFNGQIVYSSSTPPFEKSTKKVTKYLHSVAILKGIQFKDVFEKFEKSRIFHLRDSTCNELSTGEKKLFQLFIDFLSDPKVILLDEPLSGLDHQARRLVKSNLSLLAQQNKIIIISTHVFSDIENLTDKVLIVKDKTVGFYEGKEISETYNEIFSLFENEEIGSVNF